jgi:excisionase family DNA binding protein
MEGTILNISQTARILGIGREALYRQIRHGDLQTIMVRGLVRIAKRDFERFLMNKEMADTLARSKNSRKGWDRAWDRARAE